MRLKFPRLWWRRHRGDAGISGDPVVSQEETLQTIGVMLRHRRQDLGLTLRDLATETRITTPVIEALERGWRDRLPERAYLASMLPQLEQRLDLPPGSLEPVLPPRAANRRVNSVGLRRFTPGSIDVFTTWQGSVVYALVISVSVLALNRQQQELTQRNTQNLEPVRADLQILENKEGLLSRDPSVLALRPLTQAKDGRPEQWLNAGGGDPLNSPGVLQVTLKAPRRVQVSSRGGDRLDLKGSAGHLTLQLLPPIQLMISPPPSAEDQVLWNGEQQQSDAQEKGLYRMADAPRKASAPARERPQTAPRSP